MGEDLERMHDAGFDEVLVKPVESHDILLAVDRAVAAAAARR